jgi:hypothetical protein
MTLIVALVSFVAAFTLLTVITAGNAIIAVKFTTFGIDDTSLIASDWAPCDDFQAGTCY